MAFYTVLLGNSGYDLVALKATTTPTTGTNWSEQDGSVRVETGGGKVVSMWVAENKYSQFDFDVSDAGPTDPDVRWTNDSNAFDGDGATFARTASIGSSTSNYLEGQGTSAPASGGTIESVQLLLRVSNDNNFVPEALGFRVTTDGAGETLLEGARTPPAGVPIDVRIDISAPTGGWTWAKLQALEIRYWKDGGTEDIEIYRGRISVKTTEPQTFHVATQQEDGRVRYHVFDPGTDVWTTKNETVVNVGDTNFDAAPANPAVSLALRSDGDVILVAAYNDGTDETLRLFIKTTSWTNQAEATAGTASTDYTGVSVVGPDSSDRISWAYLDTTNDDVDLQSVDSGTTLGTVTEIDAAVDTATFIVASGVIDSGNEIYIPYIDASNQASVAQWTSAAAPTVTIHADVGIDPDGGGNTVLGAGRSSSPFVCVSMAVDEDEIYLIYADTNDRDMFIDVDVRDGGADDYELVDAVTVNRISINQLTATLGIIWLDGTTARYTEIGTHATLTALSQADFPVQNYHVGPFEI